MIGRKKKFIKRIREHAGIQSALTIILPLLLGILIAAAWQTQLLHRLFGTDTFTLPLLDRIGTIIVDNRGKILENVWATLLVSIAGLFCGSILGYGIAVLAAVFSKWGKGGLSIVAAFNAVPIVALAPVVTNLTKSVSKDASIRSMVAKIIVVTIVCIAAMSINAYRGLVELKPFGEDLMKSYAATKKTVFLKLRLPNSVPYIFTALRIGVPSSIISALVSEYFAEYIIGVGRQIRENIVLAQYATAWAYIAVACLLGIVLYGLLLAAEGILLKGHRLS